MEVVLGREYFILFYFIQTISSSDIKNTGKIEAGKNTYYRDKHVEISTYLKMILEA